MANYTATKNEVKPCHFSLDISVPAEDVNKAYKKIRNQLRNQVSLKGFRKGKAPDALLNRKFAKQIKDEVSQEIIRDSVQQAIQDNDLSPVTMPSFVEDKEGDLREGNDFEFAVEFDVKPQVEVPDYKGLPLEKYKFEFTEEQVDEAVKSMLERRASYGAVDRAGEAGDMLKVSFSSDLSDDEEVPEAAKRMVDSDETWILLSEPEMIPGTAEGLVGLAAGDVKELEVTYPEDHYEPFLAGKTVKYNFTVSEVHGKTTPELTDEIAKEMGAESAEDFRNSVRERMEAGIDDANQQSLNNQAREKLLEKVDFVVPPEQLEMESQSVYQQLLGQQMQMKQQPGEDAEVEEKSEDELKEEAEKQAKDRLRLRYVSEAIAEAEGIEVSPQEIKSQIDMFKMYSRMSDEEFNQRYDQMRMIEAFHADLLQNKVLSKLVDEAEITETEPPKNDADDDNGEASEE